MVVSPMDGQQASACQHSLPQLASRTRMAHPAFSRTSGVPIIMARMKTVLIVEDDPDLAQFVKAYLERAGYTVKTARDGLTGLSAALGEYPDLIVLDWMLPGIDGLEFMKRLRRERRTPVIMLTARGEEDDRVRGLELGADDYVSKPFAPRELVARVGSVLRRLDAAQEQGEVSYKRGHLTIDPSRRSVTQGGEPLDLTAREFNLLHTLASQPGRVYRRGELLDRVWGDDFAGVDRVVDVHMSNLRQKLEAHPAQPRLLLTVRSVGYKFTEDDL